MDPIRELPYRPAACKWPLIKAGHMSAPDYAPSSPKDSSCTEGGVHTCPEFFAHLVWAERRPALAQAVMAPLVCWSIKISMFR